MAKKKILFASDFSKFATGFGRNAKIVLSYLYSTGKYEIIEYATAPVTSTDERLKSVPWKAYGSVPTDTFVVRELEKNPILAPSVPYGGYYIDEIVAKEKPDCYIGVNDFWGFNNLFEKPWWNKINCAIWTTIDSLPIYDSALENAHKIKNFWVWSSFAEKEMKRLGHNHVETLHGAFDVNTFEPLSDSRKKEIRAANGIGEDDFVIGFVFRNQIRKLIGTLIEGFAIHKRRNPETKAKLLLHTSWGEGWEIEKFMKEFGVDKKDVLTTHICSKCKSYNIQPYQGESSKCKSCGSAKTLTTPKTHLGVTEAQMNEIYNVMDFYMHPITSGGLEMPLVESLMAGVPVATVDYSCGQEFCENEFVQKIDYTIYREFKTQFMKAQPCPSSVADIIAKNEGRDNSDISRAGVDWARANFDHLAICKKIEKWIDESPAVEYDFDTAPKKYNKNFIPDDSILDENEWCAELIRGVFDSDESLDSETINKMADKIRAGESREEILKVAVKWAEMHNRSSEEMSVEKIFKGCKSGENVCFVVPRDFNKKMALYDLIKSLAEEESNLFIVGDELDFDLYSSCGKFRRIKYNDRSSNYKWLGDLKDKEGKKRFKKVYYEYVNNMVELNVE